MNQQIEAYAKRLKLSWIRENYNNVEANSHQEYLLKLFEKEVQNREERKTNLLLKQAHLPKTGN
ncbi:ATP-binding protein, partial [Lentibacillus sp. N15]